MKEDFKTLQEFWSHRYEAGHTGWDIGYASTPIKAYIDQLTDRGQRILIPGVGNAYEAEYLFEQGFTSVFVLDVSALPLEALQKRVPDFPSEHLLQENFFAHEGQYDLILEQTFFCSFLPTPENRRQYARKMAQLLKPGGKLVGLWFDFLLDATSEKRPFGGSREEYLSYLQPYFEVQSFERAYNSIKPRQGNELFGIFVRKP